MAAGFDDGKDEGALRTIGEVSEALGIKAHVLRYWEGQFPQLQPMKRSGGRRYYRPEDVALVCEIDRLVNRDGYTLRGAKAALNDLRPGAGNAGRPPHDLDRDQRRDEDHHQPVPGVRPAAAATTGSGSGAETLARLRAIRETLAAALNS